VANRIFIVTVENVIHGLVLAGGKSRRMGSDKALLMRDGRSQLSSAVALLERHLPRVYVSTRRDQQDEAERSKFDQIVDRYDDMGPVAGILSALASNPEVSWLVLACDLPNVDDETIATLIAAHSVEQPFTAYKSSHDGLPEPLCAIFSPASRAVIEDFVADGLHCPRKMLIRSGTELLGQENPSALDNMNTPQDLEGTGIGIAS
jgi:molybdopterin-guanine dinucleotide biosynthesis protein A